MIRPAETASAGGDDLMGLIRQLTQQGSHLAEQQLSLVKAEVRESVSEVKVAVGSMAGAAVVGIAGLGVLLMGLAYLLGDAIENLGLATLIVGLGTLVVAFILYNIGIQKVRGSHLAPDRTVRTLERGTEAVRGTLVQETQS